jgi:hypothetical protein
MIVDLNNPLNNSEIIQKIQNSKLNIIQIHSI